MIVLDTGLELEPSGRHRPRVRRDGRALGLHGVRVAWLSSGELGDEQQPAGERHTHQVAAVGGRRHGFSAVFSNAPTSSKYRRAIAADAGLVYTSATGCSITWAKMSATSSTLCTCGPEYF